MAKIQFRLRDAEKRALARATLVMSVRFRNGEAWQSDRLTTDNGGAVWLEIGANLVRRIDWDTVTLDVRKGGKRLEHAHGKPKKINRGAYQIVVTIAAAPQRGDDGDIPTIDVQDDPRDTVTLIAALFESGGAALGNATVNLFWQESDGELTKLGRKQTNAEGEFTHHMDRTDAAALDWSRLVPVITRKDIHYHIVRREPALEIDNNLWRMQLLVQVETTPECDRTDTEDNAEPGDNGVYTVSGQVVTGDGRPVRKAVVVAYDRDVCDEKDLGRESTDKNGNYLIRYNREELSDAAKKRADLTLRVWKGETGGDVIAESPLILGADVDETVNLVVGDKRYRGPSDYDRLHQVLTEKLAGLDLSCIEQADVWLLANRTNLPVHKVYLYVISQRFANNSVLPAEVYFGLFANRGETDIASVLGRSAKWKMKELERAATANRIPAPARKGLAKKLADSEVERFLTPGTRATRLFGLAGLNRVQQERLARVYVEHDGSQRELWQKLERANVSAGRLGRLKSIIQLHTMTVGHESLVVAAVTEFDPKSSADLAAIREQDWLDLINGADVGLPARYRRSDSEQARSQYARDLATLVQQTLPTESLAARLNGSEEFKVPGVTRFLKQNPGFDISGTPLRLYLKQTDTQDDGAAAEKTLRDVESLQRLYQLSPLEGRFETMGSLWSEGLKSAPQIAARGRSAFLRRYGAKLGGGDIAARVHASAQKITNGALALYGRFNPRLNGPGTYVLPLAPANDASEKQLASVSALGAGSGFFGGLDFCAVRHCESVLSPSAYLIDLMLYIENAYFSGGASVQFENGKEVLLLRRPDIGKILLGCENSDVQLPYIDLVNEVLENIVANPDNNLLIPDDAEPQTTWTEEELKAHPEHLNVAAYNRVAVSVYPWTAPFNLWEEEARTYLGYIGIQRHELIRLFGDLGDPLTLAAYARESLQVSPGILPLTALAAPNTTALALFWRVRAADLLTQLAAVPTFLDRVQTDYNGLVALLETRFLNPDRSVVIEFAGSSCALETATLMDFDEAFLDRCHRFVRLKDALGIDTFQLDRALTALAENELDAEFTLKYAAIEWIRERWPADLEEVLSWWSAIDHIDYSGSDSLYRKLFLDPTVNSVSTGSSIDFLEEFSLKRSGELKLVGGSNTDIQWLARPTADGVGVVLNELVIAYVSAGLQLSAEEIQLIVNNDLLRGGNDVPLRMSTLARIYRIGSLARTLDITVEEYYSLVGLIGEVPVADRAEGEISLSDQTFFTGFETIQSTDFDIVELDYLLRDRDTIPPSQRFPSETIAASLIQIRDYLNGAVVGVDGDLRTRLDQVSLHLSLHPGIDAEQIEKLNAVIMGSSGWSPVEIADYVNANFGSVFDAQTGSGLANRNQNPTADRRLGLVSDQLDVDSMLVHDLYHRILQQDGWDEELAAALTAITIQVSALTDQEQADFILANVSFVDAADLVDRFTGASTIVSSADRTQYLRRAMLLEVVYQTIATAVVLDRTIVKAVIGRNAAASGANVSGARFFSGQFLDPASAIEESEFAELFGLYRRLDKIARFQETLAIRTADILLVLKLAADKDWLDLTRLPVAMQQNADFSGWQKLVTAVQLNARSFSESLSLFEYLAQLDGSMSVAELVEMTHSYTGWNPVDLEFAASYGGAAVDAGQIDEQLLGKVEQSVTLAGVAGVPLQTLATWSANLVTYENAHSIKNAVKAKYSLSQWYAIAQKLRDDLRVKQRDALLAFVIGQNPIYDSAIDIYKAYLIDAEMDPCMLTSRIKQANASLQLFVQRIMLGLEVDPRTGKALMLDKDDALEWEWRKNYRVWEANRKIFLYPENWIEPELRDNKTQIFEAYESELSQGDITEERVGEAITRYIENLDQMARLEIASMCRDAATDTFHVCARTFATPHAYFYRKWIDRSYWTPWERIEQQIEGDHLLLVHHGGRLLLIWPTFKGVATSEADAENYESEVEALNNEIAELNETINLKIESRAEKQAELDRLQDASGIRKYEREAELMRQIADLDDLIPDLEDERDEKYEELNELLEAGTQTDVFHDVSLNWLEKKGDAWSAKLTSPKTILVNLPILSQLEMRPINGAVADDLVIRLDQNMEGVYEKIELGGFRLNVCTGAMETLAISGTDIHDLFAVYESYFWNQKWKEFSTGAPFWITKAKHDPDYEIPVYLFTDELLNNTLGTFKVSKLQQYSHLDQSFFFELNNRVFFVDQNENSSGSVWSKSPHFDGIIETYTPAPGTSTGGTAVLLPDNGGGFFSKGDESLIVSKQGVGSFKGEIIYKEYLGDDLDFVAKGEKEFIPDLLLSEGKYRFHNFYHPYTCLFLRQLRRYGVADLLAPNPNASRDHEDLFRQRTPNSTFDFDIHYDPQPVVKRPYPVEAISFEHGDAYSDYNWELFFHIPFLTACRFMQNQRFADAQRWFHYIFDPTETTGGVPFRFWKLQPFFDYLYAGGGEAEGDILFELATGNSELATQIAEWEQNPFQPHLLARMRVSSYMKAVVMKYLDNLIAWGDHLFGQDTMETINEATQLYLLAGQILGRPPQSIERRAEVELTTEQLITQGVDLLGNALIDLTSYVPATPGAVVTTGSTLNTMLYFGFPENDVLNGYWDTVNDRLFKIRHCMNIEGVTRELPLYEPPIDPALLVQAAAAGVDIAGVIAGTHVSLPGYRFGYNHSKALEFCATLQSLGSQLLTAMEKRDAEELSVLSNTLGLELLNLHKVVRQDRVLEAQHSLRALEDNLQMVEDKEKYYADLIEDGLSTSEKTQAKAMDNARVSQIVANLLHSTASFLHLFPDLVLPFPPQSSFGGSHLGHSAAATAHAASAVTTEFTFQASKAGILAQQERRAQEWKFARTQADAELRLIEKQRLAAEVREAIAGTELSNHEAQIIQQEQTLELVKTKYSNEQLYDWMSRQISDIYFQNYQLAYDMAKRAERSYQHEIGSKDTFIQYGYWDSVREGLLAGEKLLHDLRRMDAQYLENNKRRFELSKHVSIVQLDPSALIQLKQTGECFIDLPEILFDLDYPGHYFRTIKSLSITIPCVAGPYTNISCTLTQLSNRVRTSADSSGDYPYVETQGADVDDRFDHQVGSIQAIATSSANQDSGLFELNFRDERYLPFEGSGALSSWRIRLTDPSLAQFDYGTISDVVFHLNYVARDGGELLRSKVTGYLHGVMDAVIEDNHLFHQLISIRSTFPDQWSRMTSVGANAHQTGITVEKNHFPYLVRNRGLDVAALQLLIELRAPDAGQPTGEILLTGPGVASAMGNLADDSMLGLPVASIEDVTALELGDWTLTLPPTVMSELNHQIKDIYLVVTYTANNAPAGSS